MTEQISNLPGGSPETMQELRRLGGLTEAIHADELPVVPDAVRNAVAGRKHVRALAAASPSASATPAEFVDQMQQRLLAGEEIAAAEFAQGAHEAWTSVDVSTHASQALLALEALMNRSFTSAVAKGLDEMLIGLRDQMAEPVEQLRAAYKALDGLDINHPDPTVVASGTAAQRRAWGEIDDWTLQYMRIRRLQRLVLLAAGPDANSILRLGSFATTMPWTDLTDKTGLLEVRSAGKPLPDAPTKRGKVHQAVTRPDLWLPTRDELSEAWHEWHGSEAANRPPTVAKVPEPEQRQPAPGDLLGI